MTLSREEINHLAALSRLGIEPDEEERFGQQLSSVLSYVQMLTNLDTSDIAYEYHVRGLADVTRPDEVNASDDQTHTTIISEFPDRNGDLLRVPGIFQSPS